MRRAFWHGVSDGILDYFLCQRSRASGVYRAIIDTEAMIVFLSFSAFSLLKIDVAMAMYHLLRAVARLGKILSEMRIMGDWPRAGFWASTHHRHTEYEPKYLFVSSIDNNGKDTKSTI